MIISDFAKHFDGFGNGVVASPIDGAPFTGVVKSVLAPRSCALQCQNGFGSYFYRNTSVAVVCWAAIIGLTSMKINYDL